MRFSAAGISLLVQKPSQPIAAGSQIVNSCLSVWRLEFHLWARNAGTGNVRPLGGHHDVTRHVRPAQVLKVPEVTSVILNPYDAIHRLRGSALFIP